MHSRVARPCVTIRPAPFIDDRRAMSGRREERTWLRTRIWRLARSPMMSTSTTGLAVYGLAAVTGPLLARSLGPSGRGDLAAVLVPGEMLGWVIAFGLPAASLYYADRYSIRQMMTAAWVFAVVVGGGLTLAAWFLVPSYLHEHDPTTVPWLRIFLLVAILFVPATTATQLLRLRADLVAYNFFRSFQLVLETVIIVVLAVAGWLDLTSALWAALVSCLVGYVAVLVYGKGWPSRSLDRRVLRDMVHYGGRLSIGNMANLLINRLDQLVMVGLVAPAQLGIYAIAATAAGASSAAADGVSTVVFAFAGGPRSEASVVGSIDRAALDASRVVLHRAGHRPLVVCRDPVALRVAVQGRGSTAAHLVARPDRRRPGQRGEPEAPRRQPARRRVARPRRGGGGIGRRALRARRPLRHQRRRHGDHRKPDRVHRVRDGGGDPSQPKREQPA